MNPGVSGTLPVRPQSPGGLRRHGVSKSRIVGVVAILALAVVVPAIFPGYWLTIAILALIYAIEAMGLNLLMGFTGLDSLGQAAFFGLGSYGLGILTVKYGVSWWPAAIAAIAIGTAGAAIIGAIAVRTRGLYFLLITAAMGQVLWGADYRWGAFTGGADGLELGGGRPSPWFYSELHFYYFTLAVFAVVTALICLIIVSPFGLTLKSIRDREVRSQTLGYVTYTHKYLAFIIAGIAATIAGILSGAYNGIASPSDLALDQSFAVMLMVIFGGSGTLAGPIVGAILITALQFELSTFWPNAWPIILGAIYVFATIYLPDGIVRGFPRFASRLKALGKAEAPADTSDVPATAEVSALRPTEPRPLVFGRATGRGAPAKPALALEGVCKSFGDLRVLSDVTFSVEPGERVGIIGLNGAGKTTLFHVISGLEPRSGGRIALFGQNVTSASPSQRAALGLSRTFQITMLYPSLTVRENMDAALLGSTYRRWRFHFWAPLSAYGDLGARSRELLEAVGLWPYRDTEVRHLSYGHQRQLEVALALAPEPSLLLLDEPTAGLAQPEIASMQRLLASLPPELTVVAVEHHLEFIFQFVRRVLVLHQGSVLTDGLPGTVRLDPQVRDLYFGAHAAAHLAGRDRRPAAG
jgi:ABC-type branched-subunit amino acid transport system ATPase component/ABC-type branched-subunit amino acid transport system permease subunit